MTAGTSPVRVRIAPSPTGPLHIGTARTALFNYLFARHTGGTFVLRMEDTDVERSTIGYEQDILTGLRWLGLGWDEGPGLPGEPDAGPYGPYRQMERLARYAAISDRLLADDQAYYCYCTAAELDAERKRLEAARLPPRYNGRCAHLTAVQRAAFEAEGRRPAIRFRIEPGVVAFDDLVRGHVEIDASTLGGDLVIVRGDGTPLYHFCVVVDDAAMKISHVIRGEDHLSNTPKHILLFRALGEAEPLFAHLPPRYSGRCAHLSAAERGAFEAEGRRPAIRFRIQPGVVAFDDLVRGHVEIDASTLGGDLVIVRGDGTPLYHFCVVVDDAAMKISHVIRGEDHLSNTPKHILLFRALGEAEPLFAHLPLILNPDRTKMSKRKSQTAVDDYINEGFIREGLVNYLALLGWSTGSEEEILGLDEIAARFSLEHVQKGGAVFDRERLEWLNGQWIRLLPSAVLVDRLRPFVQRETDARRIDRMPADAELEALVPLVQERLPVLGAIGDLVDFLFVDRIVLDPALLVPKRWDASTALEGLRSARAALSAIDEAGFQPEQLEAPLRALAEAHTWKAGDLFMTIRVAVTGRTATPPLFQTLVALGRERVLARLDAAIEALAGAAGVPGEGGST